MGGKLRSARARGWCWLIAMVVVGCGGGASTATSTPAAACVGRALTSARNVQAAIDNAPPHTSFCFGPGIYHVSSLVPKQGDVLDGGRQAAILDGGNSARYAIYGDAAPQGPSDVTIRGFVIENFRTPLQRGAIEDFNGPGWTIEANHIVHNAAAGVATGDNVTVLGNLIAHNGQEGFAAHGKGGLYEGNDIAYNNADLAVNATWEAGGGKAWRTNDLTFKDNYVHNNGGVALWADTDNINTIFEGNTVSDNWGPGIYVEISYDATITNNRVIGNGMPSSPSGGQRLGWGGTLVSSSGVLAGSVPRHHW
jgi:parallel beta-helix repeat protein